MSRLTARAGSGKAGWCMTGHHADCPSSRCTCSCHGRELELEEELRANG